MRVSVDIPEPKANGLDAALARQFADLQRQLMGLVKDQASSKSALHEMMLEGLADQQTLFLKAMERLLGMVGQATKSSQVSDGMVDALRGLKRVVSDLPGDLKDALDAQYQSFQSQSMKATPPTQVTVKLPSGLTNRLDALEDAMVQGLKHSRNRTFGSNY